MTAVALTILAGGMTSLATDFALVNGMRDLIAFIFVTGLAFGPVFHIIFGFINFTVAVHFLFLMAIVAHHAFLVVDIRCASVFAGKFGIDTTTMTGCAGFPLIFLDKFMTLQKAGGNAANRR